jgi:hypothetical protein
MALIGTFTDIGIDKSRDAANNLGFKIVPTGFEVSNAQTPGGIPALQALTSSNAGVFFTGLVSSAIILGSETVQVSVTIPPGQTVSEEAINEIYLYAKDIDNNDFLLAVGQPASGSNILYSPDGESTLRLQLRLTNTDITSFIQFDFTQAVEISEHNQDPNAHPDIRDLLELGGFFAQPAAHEFIGQAFDEFPTFDPSVDEDDLVFLDTDGVYKQAVKDGSKAEKVAGIAKIARDLVASEGIVKKLHGFDIDTRLYLHPSNPGQVTDVPSGIPLGIVRDTSSFFLRVDEHQQVSEFVDTVVSDEPGFNHYSNAQDAIDATPAGGWVRFDKLFELQGASPLTTSGKQINFLFTGISSGVQKFLGINEIQTLSFDAVPDSGDFLVTHDGNDSGRISWNDNAAAIEAILEAMPSITDVTVSGDFSSGFTIEFTGVDGLQDQLQITPGVNPGVNEIQTLEFDSDDFDSGSFELDLDAQTTNAIAFNQITALNIKTELEALSNVTSVTVTEVVSPPPGTTQFTIEFDNVDGLKPFNNLTVENNSLQDSNPSAITGSVTETQIGRLPDNLLTSSSVGVNITANTTQEGDVIGTDVAFDLDANGIQFAGLGRITGFDTGIDLNSVTNTRIEMFFDALATPINVAGVGINDYNTDGSIGLSNTLNASTAFRDLVKVTSQIPVSFITDVSAASVTLSDGSKHGFIVDQAVSNFAGGSVNWATGSVTGGPDFTPYTAITASNYYKYAIVLRPDDTILVLPPVGENADPNLVPIPPISGGILRAIVTIQDDGSGGIENVEPSDIVHFHDMGAFAKTVAQIAIAAGSGGQSVFDISSFTNITFNPSNVIIGDIKVEINGIEQVQDQTGGLNEDYRKNSGTEIEFSFDVPDGEVVHITLLTTTIDNLSQTATQASFKTYVLPSDDSATYDFVAQSANWSADNAISDIEVFLDGVLQLQDETGVGNRNFIKTSATAIQFTQSGGPFPISTGSQIVVKSRDFVIGGGNATPPVYTRDEGSILATPVTEYDFVGANIQTTQTAPGKHQIEALPDTGVNLGTGVGQVFKDRTGLDLNFRSVKAKALGGLLVEQIGDEILLSLASGSYFRSCSDNHSTTTIPVGESYQLGTKRLMPYKNGVRMINTGSLGVAADRYAENASTTDITVPVAAIAADWFCFINEEGNPDYSMLIDGSSLVGATSLTVPLYTVGTEQFRIWRNGSLMNRSGLGTTTERYSETGSGTSVTINLDEAVAISDVFHIEHLSSPPAYREDIGNFVGSTLTVATAYTLGNDKAQLYKNGKLINKEGLGTASEQYSETTTTTFTLGSPANLADWYAVIVKS